MHQQISANSLQSQRVIGKDITTQVVNQPQSSVRMTQVDPAINFHPSLGQSGNGKKALKVKQPVPVTTTSAHSQRFFAKDNNSNPSAFVGTSLLQKHSSIMQGAQITGLV